MNPKKKTNHPISVQWLDLNSEYLNRRLNVLRLLLNRRILWLRSLWRNDPLQSCKGTIISDLQADFLLRGEDREAEARFYHENQEASAISRSLAEQEHQLAERTKKLRDAGTPPALEILARLFGLHPFEQEVLFLCLAPELDPGFEQLYAYVQDVPRRTYATWHMSRFLLERTKEDRTAAQYGLLPDAPLRRYLLLTLEPGQHGATPQGIRPLRLNERISDYLRGINRPDDRLTGLLRPIPNPLNLPGHQELAERWIAFLDSFDQDCPWPVLNLTGPKRSGKYSLARAICDRLRLQLISLDLRKAAAPGTDIRDLARLLDREAILLGAVIYIDTAGYSSTDPSLLSAAGEIIERLGTRLIIASEERWPTERELLVIPLSRPDAAGQLHLWRQALEGVTHSIDGRIPALVEQFDFGPEEITRTVASARNKAKMRCLQGDETHTQGGVVQTQGEAMPAQHETGEAVRPPLDKSIVGEAIPQPEEASETGEAIPPPEEQSVIEKATCPQVEAVEALLLPEDLWQAAREQAGQEIKELSRQIIPCYQWEDIVLPEDVLRQLREIAAQVANRPQVYETWGFGAKLSRGRGINALFSGPSGTGKTMAAEVMANHLKLDLFRIDLASVVSKYIGETEKNLKKVFDAAEESGAILFFDEADALFGKRTEVKDSHDRYANIEVNYLLQRMEDYRGLAILATNRKSAIDSAFLRRLRFLVDFPFPRAESRRQIWQQVFPPRAPLDGVDFNHLANLEISGGSIRNIALNAAFLAAQHNKKIGMVHVMRAAKREYAKIEKMIGQAEFGIYYQLVKS